VVIPNNSNSFHSTEFYLLPEDLKEVFERLNPEKTWQDLLLYTAFEFLRIE